jgi:dolichol-phosphate mannosyltransferase
MCRVDLSIVIPCYNEIETIAKLKAELLPVLTDLVRTGIAATITTAAALEVIFVDDGSQDGTFFALLDAFGDEALPGVTFRFTQHRTNQGLGAALRTGFDHAQGAVIVTTDCDGTYQFNEIPQLLAQLTPDVDLVTASPYHPDGAVDGVSGYRLLLSRGSSTIYRMLADRRVHTYTALFRAYRREVIQNVPFHATGFLAGTELLVNALRMGYTVAEYPTILHSRAFGVSKAKIMRTVRAHLGFQMNTLLPWHPYGLIVRGASETIYLINDGVKHAFPSPEVFLSHGYHWQQVAPIAQEELDALPDGQSLTFRDGALLRGSDETIYVVEEGVRRPFTAAQDFAGLGYRWENVMAVSDDQLALLPLGRAINRRAGYPNGALLRGTDRTVYLLVCGRRCVIANRQIFQSWGYQWEHVIDVTEAELAHYPLGEPITAQKSMFQHWRALHHHNYTLAQAA